MMLSIYMYIHSDSDVFSPYVVIKELVQSEHNTPPEHQKGEEVYILK